MFDILAIQSPSYSSDGFCPSYGLQVNNFDSRIRDDPVLRHIFIPLANNLDSRIRDDPVLRPPLANHFGSRIREDPVLRVVWLPITE